jgi:transcriptional regulator with XRE-family HTH domain
MLPPIANEQLRLRRHAAGLTESQLAEAVAVLVSAQTGRRAALDGNYVSKLERGRITWPNSAYRRALREIFAVPTDAELGFYAARTRRDAERLLSAPDGHPALADQWVLASRGRVADRPAAVLALPTPTTTRSVPEASEVFRGPGRRPRRVRT